MLLMLIAGSREGWARNPEDVFAQKIITSAKRLPTSASSKGEYIAKLRKMSTQNFQEDRERKRWKVFYAAFFQRPLDDLEVTVKLYDVTGGQPPKLVTSFEQYLERRGQRTFNADVVLERQFFGVNRQILMSIENRGRRLASTKFKILGQAERFTGKVDFSDEEAAKGGD
jgi:hypothetical protein